MCRIIVGRPLVAIFYFFVSVLLLSIIIVFIRQSEIVAAPQVFAGLLMCRSPRGGRERARAGAPVGSVRDTPRQTRAPGTRGKTDVRFLKIGKKKIIKNYIQTNRYVSE